MPLVGLKPYRFFTHNFYIYTPASLVVLTRDSLMWPWEKNYHYSDTNHDPPIVILALYKAVLATKKICTEINYSQNNNARGL